MRLRPQSPNRHLVTRLALTLTAAGGLALGACNKDEKPADGKGATPAAAAPKALTVPDVLKNVPGDTPYLFANFEPMPKPVLDKIFAKMAPLFGDMTASLDAQLAAAPAEDTGAKVARALLEELKGHMSAQGIEQLGLSTTPHMALYGIGLLPAVRLELKDAKAFKELVSRVETKVGQKVPTAKAGEQEYWLIESGDGFVAAAVVGNELVFGLGPAKAKDLYLPLLLGTAKPASTLADGGALLKIVEDYKFSPTGTGYVDIKGISRTIMGDATGLNADIYKLLADAAPALSPDCKAEIGGLVDLAPRVVFGYEELNETVMVADFVIETKPEIGKDLAGLRAAVPGLTKSPAGNPLLVFGLGLDIEKAIGWAKAKAAAVQATPYKCEMLAPISQGAGNLVAGLNGPLPPFVNLIKGVALTVQEANLENANLAMGPAGALQDAKAYLTISATNPSELLGAVKLMLPPPIAALTINPDGKAVALPAEGLPPFIKSPMVTMTSNAIALSVGEGTQATVDGVLKAAPAGEPPLFVIGYNVGKFMGAMAKQMESSLAGLPPEEAARRQADLKASKAAGDLFGFIALSLNLSEKGVVLQERLNWN